jgi:hypothetical protein
MSLRLLKSLTDIASSCEKEKDGFDVCLIIQDYDSLVEDFIQILHSVCKLNVYPKFRDMRCGMYRGEDLNDSTLLFKTNYEKEVTNMIKNSKLVIAVVTGRFTLSEKCLELVKYTKRVKKSIIGLIVEEFENHSRILTTTLKGFNYYCDIYKDRINPIGYDHYLWISESFNKLLRYLGTELDKKFVSILYLCFTFC